MAILVSRDTRLLVMGISGRYARNQVREMVAYGSRVVAGVTLGRGGETVDEVPVYDTVREALQVHAVEGALLYVPAPAAREAALEVLEAGIRLAVIVTEGMPVHDASYVRAFAEECGAWVVGPNTAGLIAPGQCLAGSIAPSYTMPGPVGLLSRSGTLSFEVARSLTEAGLGQSTVVAIGGDAVIGKNPAAYLQAFEEDPDTEAVVLLGEVGGQKEHEAAAIVAQMTKPVVALIVGRSVPPGKTMGHAGAFVASEDQGAEAKERVLRDAGCLIADTLWEIPHLVGQALGRGLQEATP